MIEFVAGGTTFEERGRAIVAALEQEEGGVSRAAARLGIKRSAFWYHLRQHGLEDLPRRLREKARRIFEVE